MEDRVSEKGILSNLKKITIGKQLPPLILGKKEGINYQNLGRERAERLCEPGLGVPKRGRKLALAVTSGKMSVADRESKRTRRRNLSALL